MNRNHRVKVNKFHCNEKQNIDLALCILYRQDRYEKSRVLRIKTKLVPNYCLLVQCSMITAITAAKQNKELITVSPSSTQPYGLVVGNMSHVLGGSYDHDLFLDWIVNHV
jgi:hypothetical protein